jgi:predicted phage baseplate assembly protein
VAGPEDRVYVVRIDDDSRATVIFGDGERGARLPTGQENVRARYRSGIGPAGEVPAGSLSLLPQRPLGIASVTNPLPATGGAAPEQLDDARVNAPLTVLTLDRVVSVRDHEDFARAFGGIAKARAVALWVRTRRLVHLTVAAAGGTTVDTDTIGRLRKALGTFGGDVTALRIDSPQPQFFTVGLALLTDPARIRSDVETAVTVALRAAFEADRRSFGQPVTSADVLSLVHRVPGVVAASLTQLEQGNAVGVQEVLVADDARFAPTAADPDRILPAELLLLDARDIAFSEMAP